MKKGQLFSEEWKHKHSIRMKLYYQTHTFIRKGHPISQETRQKISIANKGHKHTLETRRKLAEKSRGNKNRLGVHHTEESKLKMSIARKGRKPWCYGKKLSAEHRQKIREVIMGNKNMLGKHHTEETKKKLRAWQKTQIGEISPNWQGGISFMPYGVEFNRQLKEQIRIRDNFCCQFPDCGIPENGRKHDIHHINYDKNNCLPKNLLLLCRSHNGKVNSNRAYWTTYFIDMRRV